MKIIKHIMKLLFFIIVLFLLLFMGSMTLYPEQTSEFIGYRFYTVLTNSMEPRIPTYSLVCSKVIKEDEQLKLEKGDVITFKANRFQEDVLITHHFNKTEKTYDGKIIYRTNAEGKKDLDMYETHRSDIIGLYVFHIPYIGKIILFLQSPFGFIMYGELFVIYLINKVIQTRWGEKEEEKKEKALEDLAVVEQAAIASEHADDRDVHVEKIPASLYISDIRIEQQGSQCEAYAVLHNISNEPKQNVFIELTLYDVQHRQTKRYVIRTMKHQAVLPNETQAFCFRFHCRNELSYYTMNVLG